MDDLWSPHERREIMRPPTPGAETNEGAAPAAAVLPPRRTWRAGAANSPLVNWPKTARALLARPNAIVAPLWMIAFAVATYVASLPQFAPIVPGTDLRLISVPMALLAIAFMLRPKNEVAVYALIYAAVSISFEFRSPELGFASVRALIEILQTLILR